MRIECPKCHNVTMDVKTVYSESVGQRKLITRGVCPCGNILEPKPERWKFKMEER